MQKSFCVYWIHYAINSINKIAEKRDINVCNDASYRF